MSDNSKPTEAEEIFSEFQKTKQQSEQIPEPEPTPQTTAPEPEPEPVVEEIAEPVQETVEKEQTTEAKSSEETETKERNVIFVGTKPIMTYVTATLTQLSTQPTVTIKARGKRITQAVDVSQMIVKRMNTVGYRVSDVRIASDSLTSQDGKKRNVSTIEIDITQK